MRKLALVAGIVLLTLAGCTKDWNPMRHVIIDWVDFVKLNGNTYEGLHEAVLASPDLVTGEIVGVVKFNVDKNVTNPRYKTKDGDAAFLDKGTKLYAIQGLDKANYIAVQDSTSIHGYKVYSNREAVRGEGLHFDDLDQTKVSRIGVYEQYDGNGHLLAKYESEAVRLILGVLNRSVERSDSPGAVQGERKHYRLIFYDGRPIAQMHHVVKDNSRYFWHPSKEYELDESIGQFLR